MCIIPPPETLSQLPASVVDGGTMPSCYLCLVPSPSCLLCGAGVCSLHIAAHTLENGNCCPLEVRHDPEHGHYFVTRKALVPGELLIREMPVVMGPYTR